MDFLKVSELQLVIGMKMERKILTECEMVMDLVLERK